jgi:pre-mRNA 3'-end-processing factor FIP1
VNDSWLKSITLAQPPQNAPTLTTEYTPRERGAATNLPASQSTPGPPNSQTLSSSTSEQKQTGSSDGVDASTLPVATAPPSHPQLDLETPGVIDGRSILEYDLNALSEKNWRRPGADISDWFNYGFDEVSWEAYCYRRREVNELANVLKTNVLVRTFSSIPSLWITFTYETVYLCSTRTLFCDCPR